MMALCMLDMVHMTVACVLDTWWSTWWSRVGHMVHMGVGCIIYIT
jgi:hypothetical protein